MKFATIRNSDGSTSAARVERDTAVLLSTPDVGSLLGSDRAVNEIGSAPFADCDLAPLVTRPSKIFCVGLNYKSHIQEMGHELPAHPTLFAKFARCLIGAHDNIALAPGSDAMDWEAELTIVVGSEVRNAGLDEAAEAIAGFTVANDITARDWQNRTLQWLQGKALEASTPVGPVMTDFAEADGAADLEVTCTVDGELMQSARTSDLLFSPTDLVAYISRVITLEPGDLILTGTSAGVGHGRKPPVYLQPGQVVRTSIEGIGELVNTCTA